LVLAPLHERRRDLVQIVVHDHVVVGVQCGRVLVVVHVDVIPAVVLPRLLARRQEHRVILLLGVQRPGLLVVVPRLDEQHAGFRPGVWLEGIAVQPDHRQDAGTLGDPLPDSLVPRVVEAPLGQDDRRPAPRLQELKVPLDKQDVAPDGLLPAAFVLLRQVILRQDADFLDVTGEGRIGQEEVEIEELHRLLIPAVLILILELAKPGPEAHAGRLAPHLRVERVGPVDIGFPVARDGVQRLGDANRAWIEVDAIDSGRRVLGHPRLGLLGLEVVIPYVHDGVNGEAA
jgi:hypothetical protein